MFLEPSSVPAVVSMPSEAFTQESAISQASEIPSQPHVDVERQRRRKNIPLMAVAL